MTLVPLPALADNYTCMLKRGPDPLEVDPGPAQPTFDTLGRGEPQLAAILDTHRCADHDDGVAIRPMRPVAMRQTHPILRIREAILPEAMRVHAAHSVVASDALVHTALHPWKSDFR
ncbi:hypothetical protein [Variovorax rhizosphaerae]|uniref:Uncharacterized protein n=1 Tax=Variovorax rhizosphaerae TaxID=1836200 RepID=A0ABU8WSW8_9BURK